MMPDLIVIHYTDLLTAQEALTRLCDPEAKVSAHFLITKEGTLYQLVDPKLRAWHAGLSSWEGDTDINSRSIGIELDNHGHTFGPEPFPPAQMMTLLEVLEELCEVYRIPRHRIVGHSDVAPLRKQDPGALFPWADLATHGFGLWPTSDSNRLTQMTVVEIQEALTQIGYACPLTGVLDDETKLVCLAFQRHFTPSELTGIPSDSMVLALQVVMRALNHQNT